MILWWRRRNCCGTEKPRARLSTRGLDLRESLDALLSECLACGLSLAGLGRERGTRLLDPSVRDPRRTERAEAVPVGREEGVALGDRFGGVGAARSSVAPASKEEGDEEQPCKSEHSSAPAGNVSAGLRHHRSLFSPISRGPRSRATGRCRK